MLCSWHKTTGRTTPFCSHRINYSMRTHWRPWQGQVWTSDHKKDIEWTDFFFNSKFQILQTSILEQCCCRDPIFLLSSNQFRATVNAMAAGISQKHILLHSWNDIAFHSSLHNNTELNVVLSYVEQLLNGQIERVVPKSIGASQKLHIISRQQLNTDIPKANLSDIGLISPYKSQCRQLKSACEKRNWEEIKIGSLEIFQGQERPIVIVSTVRSEMRSVGFLDNFRVGWFD